MSSDLPGSRVLVFILGLFGCALEFMNGLVVGCWLASSPAAPSGVLWVVLPPVLEGMCIPALCWLGERNENEHLTRVMGAALASAALFGITSATLGLQEGEHLLRVLLAISSAAYFVLSFHCVEKLLPDANVCFLNLFYNLLRCVRFVGKSLAIWIGTESLPETCLRMTSFLLGLGVLVASSPLLMGWVKQQPRSWRGLSKEEGLELVLRGSAIRKDPAQAIRFPQYVDPLKRSSLLSLGCLLSVCFLYGAFCRPAATSRLPNNLRELFLGRSFWAQVVSGCLDILAGIASGCVLSRVLRGSRKERPRDFSRFGKAFHAALVTVGGASAAWIFTLVAWVIQLDPQNPYLLLESQRCIKETLWATLQFPLFYACAHIAPSGLRATSLGCLVGLDRIALQIFCPWYMNFCREGLRPLLQTNKRSLVVVAAFPQIFVLPVLLLASHQIWLCWMAEKELDDIPVLFKNARSSLNKREVFSPDDDLSTFVTDVRNEVERAGGREPRARGASMP